MALSCNPRLVIADEPTTALDVTTQAQLLELMMAMVEQFKSSLIIVTHNLGVVARYAKRLYIMYAGRIVESGPCREVFREPRHPYTHALLRCVPRIDEQEGRKLEAVKGLPPNLCTLPGTCAFLPRCLCPAESCFSDPWPELHAFSPGHETRCVVDASCYVDPAAAAAEVGA